ncbi:hypothetical protein L6164_034741 [Bauhinia variegata]|uniref:Uncharacterized protein n=1 Tax=Bauhinia variegata TaxID=167791 RepID=A0ACB9KWG8_BAUVA|nr:hypothetical protein L6164_034741 [Bauhinia variegata]
MEGISGSWSEYWRKRGYRRLNGSGYESRRKSSSVELGNVNTRRRRLWRIKIAPKIKTLRRASPKKMLLWLRDAYVRMMMGLANSRVVSISAAAASGYGGALPGGDVTGGFAMGTGPPKEYDPKMILQIYRSLMMAQGQLVPRDAPRITSEILCRR